MWYVLSLPGSSYVLIVQLRLDEVSLAVILSVTQAGTQSGQIRAIVCEAERHKCASNGAQAKMHCLYKRHWLQWKTSWPISCPGACVIAAQRVALKQEKQGRVNKGRAVIWPQQEGSGIESNLGHGIAPPLLFPSPPHYKRSHLQALLTSCSPWQGCPHDSYVYTPKWHHCRSNPSERKNGLIDRNSQFPSRLLQAKKKKKVKECWLCLCALLLQPLFVDWHAWEIAGIITSAALSSLDSLQIPFKLDLNVTAVYQTFCSVCMNFLITWRGLLHPN